MDIASQIDRYFKAVHGKDYVFRAPETFPNAVERWMLAVAADSEESAEEEIRLIEQHMAQRRT
jgi:hypothetical protein